MTDRGFTPSFSITNAITPALTRIERARGFPKAGTLSEDWVQAIGERALVLEAHTPLPAIWLAAEKTP